LAWALVRMCVKLAQFASIKSTDMLIIRLIQS
jgi:hypothetical protein